MRIKQSTRETIAYIAVKHPSGTFTTYDIPKPLRKGMTGAVYKGHVQTMGRMEDHKDGRIFQFTEQGLSYAKRYASTEMEAVL